MLNPHASLPDSNILHQPRSVNFAQAIEAVLNGGLPKAGRNGKGGQPATNRSLLEKLSVQKDK